MNPADIAQAAPVAHDLSLFSLFWQAHIARQARDGRASRRLGLVLGDHHRQDASSTPAPSGPWIGSRRSSGRASRSRSSIAPTRTGRRPGSPRSSSPPCASGSAPSRDPAARSRASSQRIDKVLDVTIQREVERLDARLMVLASIGSAGPYIGLFGTVIGHHELVHLDRRLEEHEPRGRRARHRRGAVCHRHRPFRGDPGGARLQQAAGGGRRSCSRASKASPTSSRRSCRARSTSASRSQRNGRATWRQRAWFITGAGDDAAAGAAGAINEINMTPFIDVMLVLLIIFMVAAPLMTVGVPLDLPQTRAAPLNVDAKPVTLSIRQNGQIFLGRDVAGGRGHRRQARRGRKARVRGAHLRARRQARRLRPRRPGDVDRHQCRLQARRARDRARPAIASGWGGQSGR